MPMKRFASKKRPTKVKTVAGVKKIVNKQLLKKAEKKHHYQVNPGSPAGPNTFTLVPQTGVIYHLNGITQGTSAFQRIGDMITQLRVTVRAFMRPNQESLAEYNRCRLMLLYDRQTNSALPTVAQILQNVLLTPDPYSFRNPDTQKRFITLSDKIFTIINASNPGQTYAPKMVTLNYSKKLMTEYDESNGTIGSISTGSILLLAITDSAEEENVPELLFRSIITYTDV